MKIVLCCAGGFSTTMLMDLSLIHIFDDGWSGTNFERPSFQRMIEDIEAGKINCVVKMCIRDRYR